MTLFACSRVTHRYLRGFRSAAGTADTGRLSPPRNNNRHDNYIWWCTTMCTQQLQDGARRETEREVYGRQLLRARYWKLRAARRTEFPALSHSDHALFRPSPSAAGEMRRLSTARPYTLYKDFNNTVTSSPAHTHMGAFILANSSNRRKIKCEWDEKNVFSHLRNIVII